MIDTMWGPPVIRWFVHPMVIFNSYVKLPEGTTDYKLVGGFKHVLFSIIYGIILPIDFHIFQDG